MIFQWTPGSKGLKVTTINPLTTNVPCHIETNQLICRTNQLTGFYRMGTLDVNGLTSVLIFKIWKNTSTLELKNLRENSQMVFA